MEDISIAQMQKLQYILWEENIGDMSPLEPEYARESLLWMFEQIGNAVAIIKKNGDDQILADANIREKIVNEFVGLLMNFNDCLLRYGITADELANAYIEKHKRNMAHDYKNEFKGVSLDNEN